MLRQHFISLTPRGREVFSLAVSGLLNKRAAAELGISEFTCQIDRSKVTGKMKAASLVDLVRVAGHTRGPLSARESPKEDEFSGLHVDRFDRVPRPY